MDRITYEIMEHIAVLSEDGEEDDRRGTRRGVRSRQRRGRRPESAVRRREKS